MFYLFLIKESNNIGIMYLKSVNFLFWFGNWSCVKMLCDVSLDLC